MAQTNVMVTYAPARRPAARAAGRDRARDGGRRNRWSATLAGALLAGGTVFALGTFVRPDGSLRDTGFPAGPGAPLATTNRVPLAQTTPRPDRATPPEVRQSPLPYLALVRDAAPGPAIGPPAATPHSPSRAAAREAAPAPRRVAMNAVVAPVPAAGSPPTQEAGLAPPPSPAPVTGQRRDLEGFLGEQGLTLTPPMPAASETIAPVEKWSPGDFAPATADAPPAAPAPASELAAVDTAPPAPLEPGIGAAMAEPIEDSPASVALTDVSEPGAPSPGAPAEMQRIAEIAPAANAAERPAADDAMAAGRLYPTAAPVSRLVLTQPPPTPPLAPPASATVAAPVASHAQLFPMAVVNGEALGAVTLRDLGAQGQAIHLGALIGLLKLRMPEAQFAWLSSAAAANSFVTLDQLRAAGITVQFDAREGRLLIDAR